MMRISCPVWAGFIGGGGIVRANLNGCKQLPELARVTAPCDAVQREGAGRGGTVVDVLVKRGA